tara:strand:+ start:3759 stop:4790 length:1032 start_codon:yes stop_codon:yes gene_type:complete
MSRHTSIISIVTPTYNRIEELHHLYKSLKEQSIDDDIFEFIISDDGSTDATAETVRKWQNDSKFKIKFITQDNQGPGAARNHGLKNAEGDLILFIDSDCEAHYDWIRIIYEEYKKDSFDAFGGPDSAKEDFTRLQKAIDFAMTSFITTGGMRGHSEKMISKFFPRTHNMGIKKSLYNEIGGFINLRHGQDIEFSNRIIKTGARVKFLLNAKVYHRRRTTIKQFFKQVFNWGVARINLGKIDSSMLEPIHFLPSLSIFICIALVIFLFINNFMIYEIFLILITPLLMLSFFGAIKKNDFFIFPILLFVIPAQIFGYGIGFLQAYIRRFIFNQDSFVGFKKNYYK